MKLVMIIAIVVSCSVVAVLGTMFGISYVQVDEDTILEITTYEESILYCSSRISDIAQKVYGTLNPLPITPEVAQNMLDELPVKFELGVTSVYKLTNLFNVEHSKISFTAINANGVNAYWVENDSENVLLYFHGGAYVGGSPIQNLSLMLSFLSQNNFNVLTVDYRLAPTHPYPAALEDGKAAYEYLLEKGFSPENIVVSGNSSGGGLALGTMLALRDEGEQLPAAIALMSPWSDLTMSRDTYDTLKDVDKTSREILSWPAEVYVGNDSFQNPYISPINGDFKKFPPVLLQVGDREVFLSEVSELAQKMRADGVDVTLEVWECMWHGFQNRPMLEARDALSNIALFFDEHISK